MTDFSQFTDEEIEALVSLPYKAGIWVSHADDEDGNLDDDREQKALEVALKHVSQLETHDDFVRNILSQTLSESQRWSEWAHACFSTPAQAEKVSGILKAKTDTETIRDYCAAVMEVSSTVARAYGEFGYFDGLEAGGIGALVGKIMNKFSGLTENDADHPMNVSVAESSVLSKLKDALLKEILINLG